MSDPYVNLHVHSEYSLLDGLPSVKGIAERAATLAQPAIALTDHGVMFGAIEFYDACKKAGVKPIVGMESYLARRGRGDREAHLDGDPWHLLLLAENDEGYKNLMRLATMAQLEGFYSRPRVDKEILAAHSAGIICTSGCLSAEIPDLLRAGRVVEAFAALSWYRDVFGDRFYIELQKHAGLSELDPINAQLIQWSRETGAPLIATSDAHYLRAEDAEAHDILLCVQTGKTIDDPKRLRMTSRDYYLRTADEMAHVWGEVPEALTNTLAIAERCNVDLSFKSYHLPKFHVPDGYTAHAYLSALCEHGFRHRYGDATQLQSERLEYELGVITKMGFDTYFLIVWDLIRHAQENGIWFNVRGSAASSIVAYALGITSIEPLSNHLIFERFLNPDRISMPDIDLDFADDERGRMLEYAVTKYGKENVAQIISFGRMLAKGAVRDVGRALDYAIPEVDRIAKLIPGLPGQTLTDALAQSEPLKTLYESDPRAKNLLDVARSLEGVTRNASTHPAGLIIADRPIVDYAPLHRATNGASENGVSVTQYAMNDLEKIGLLKIDFLGLATLSLMRNVCGMIRARYGITLDLTNIPLEDTEAFALLARGDVLGIFQVEGEGLKKVLVEMKPTKFEHIVAAIALYRPGPLQYIPTYIKRMHGKEPIAYLHPSLETILADTYGVVTFQEQIMQIASDCCGFSGAEADSLRKAVSKKKKEDLAAQREKFVRGAVARAGMTAEIANKIFDDFEFFARYGFNRAHATNYATLTCQTAYLKAHYPLEYQWAMCNNETGDFEKLPLLVAEARRAGIQMLPPDVSASDVQFSIEPETRGVRYGLGAIKNVGEVAARTIVAAQRQGGGFNSLEDFCQRVPLKQVNRRALESLIAAGALDGLGERAALLKSVERLIHASVSFTATRDAGQMSLFGGTSQNMNSVELGFVPPLSASDKADREQELMGVAFSENMVQRLEAALETQRGKILTLTALADCNEKSGMVKAAGVIKNIRQTKTKAKNETMAFVSIEDQEGEVEMVLFPRAYANAVSLLQKGAAVVAEGRLQTRDDKQSFLVERLSLLFEDRTNGESAKPPFAPPPVEGGERARTEMAHESDRAGSQPAPVENVNTLAVVSDSSAASTSPTRRSGPPRRVGKAGLGNANAVVSQVTTAPPRRRSSAVFGTRGKEIAPLPPPITAAVCVPVLAVAEETDVTVEESEIDVRLEDEPNDKIEEMNVDETSSDVTDMEKSSVRRIYVRFRELPHDTVEAYEAVLSGVFENAPGQDAMALVFDGPKEQLIYEPPNRVNYDEISEIVLDLIQEDAVVEVFDERE